MLTLIPNINFKCRKFFITQKIVLYLMFLLSNIFVYFHFQILAYYVLNLYNLIKLIDIILIFLLYNYIYYFLYKCSNKSVVDV